MRKKLYILMGPQGSGKTHWAKNVLLAHDQTGIVRISQDDQGRDGCRQLFKTCLDQDVSMIIDRMNFNLEQRDRFTHPAFSRGYAIVFIWFDVDKNTCLRRLAHRENHPTVSKDADHDKMLDFYFDKFEPPHFDEYDEMLILGRRGKSSLLDIRGRCHNKKTIVVGDIHGCHDEFIALLEKCEYADGDIVVSTGDIIDRGPKIRDTLLWFRETPGAYVVEGNHENKYRRYLMGNSVKIINGLDRTIDQCKDFDPTEWAAWLIHLPQMIRLPDIDDKPAYVVHAGVDGRRPIDNQRIETCLYSRYLDGKDFFDEENGILWWKTLDGSYTVASGHIMSETAHPCESAYCLDGGVYKGGVLRALVISQSKCRVHEVNWSD